MSWTRSELKRSYPCNPELIKFLRERKKWSQKKLAKESGYCERLICKAESGGSIASATIEVLAKTLSTEDMKVFPEDLISDPVALTKKFIQAAHTLQGDMVKGVEHFTDHNGEFNFVQCGRGDYAGYYKGINELDIAVQKFFAAQSFVEGQDYEGNYSYYGDGNNVVAWGQSQVCDAQSGETFHLNVTLRMSYEKGKLCRIEDRSEVQDASCDLNSTPSG